MPTKADLLVTHNIEEAVRLTDRIVMMDKDPGRLVTELRVSLPHPRRRKDPAFLEVVDQVYAILAGQTQPEPIEMGTAPGEAGRTRALPHLAINDLAGFIAHVHEAPQHRADIYQVAADLKVRLDALLPLTEAAELLGFATVAQGDITLTPLGETFAEASILARKEIFASRIRRLPIFRWLLGLLAAADSHQLDKEVVAAALDARLSRGRGGAPGRGSHQLGSLCRAAVVRRQHRDPLPRRWRSPRACPANVKARRGSSLSVRFARPSRKALHCKAAAVNAPPAVRSETPLPDGQTVPRGAKASRGQERSAGQRAVGPSRSHWPWNGASCWHLLSGGKSSTGRH